MSEAFMAYPELRHPFEETPVHPSGHTTILYQGRNITLAETGAGDDLLIRPADLKVVNGFELKPEGACLGDLCIPINDEMLINDSEGQWFNLSAFANLLEQPFVADLENRCWSFAEIPAKRTGMMVDAMVPDIELTDRKGNVFRLPDLKGKKALIVTWSSW